MKSRSLMLRRLPLPTGCAISRGHSRVCEPGRTATLDGVLADCAAAARRTDELVTTLPDLDVAQPLPKAPWFPAGAWWSARRVLMRLLAETTQHGVPRRHRPRVPRRCQGHGQARLTRSE